ncbi:MULTISPECIES: hypothetical protein [Dyella]|uniref:Uncharacterized protein n=2 Tax=Dyella TaxID=231454 RepID=A0A4R0YUU4_9GAMM|nr:MULTISPECIES: hypothetical protein [Dyella]TBR40176.1 hypothetical protein EYV96_08415 [Dyella terrae]TCI12241.1 hypothetical protein EZM97_02455 [Dyella soli]
MKPVTRLASMLALTLAGATSLALAQDAPAPPPAKSGAPAKAAPRGGDRHDQRGPRDDDDRGMMFGGRFGPPDSPVIGDLRDLERLYVQSGRAKELPALYNSVLAKSQDPRVRTYVYHQLARAQAAPTNVDQAIATLRKSLDENLAQEAKRRDEMEKMRAAWQQRAGNTPPPPPPAQ